MLGVALFFHGAAQAQNADAVWIESEAFTSSALGQARPNIAGWGRSEFLSDGKWMQISVEAGDVEKSTPAGGVLLSYKFNLAGGGKHEIWNRIGYEFVRSPLEWRVDGGDWTPVSPDELTTDLMALQDWTEVAWLKLGERSLNAGAHTLEIRLPRTKNDKNETQRILYASDALVIAPGFAPNGRFKPGEDGRDERDKQAAAGVFQLPEARGGARAIVALRGDWEVTRNDEQAPPFNVAQPMTDFPAQPHWKAIPVPSNKNEARPDLLMAHRLWYRTRVHVPASLAGRSFFLDFPLNNLNTTVYVNGVLCGFNKNPFAHFQIDVTRGVKPGQVNEVWVGIRDAYYGLSTSPKNPLKLRRKFNTPIGFVNQGWGEFAYPVWNEFQSGILNTPSFVAAGPVYASDVFVKPSVQNKRLAAEVTLSNPSEEARSGQIVWQAIDDRSGATVKTFAPEEFTVPAGQSVTLDISDAWADARLWWPEPNPQLYRLRVTLHVDGRPADVSETRFGFREWRVDGRHLRLNGVKWHGWADVHTHPTKEQWLDFYRKTNQRFTRLWKSGGWQGLPAEEALDWFDRNGVVVRRSGVMDGQAIGMTPGEPDEDLKAFYKERYPNYSPEAKLDLAINWRDQIVAQVRGERNHPSINVWSIENEWIFIAARNTGQLDRWEPIVTDVSKAVSAIDPTRPNMIDGGGATRLQSLPIHGDHYVAGAGDTRYPELAYEPNPPGGGWTWDRKRPRYIGEELFAAGHNPQYALWGGEQVFLGQQATRPAVGRLINILTQGYRWVELTAVHYWQGQNVAVDQYRSNAPLAVFVRQWDWTFGSGEAVKRTFGIFNDTFHATGPIRFTRTLEVGGKRAWSKTTTHIVPPGENLKFDEALPMPEAAGRREGVLRLKLESGGRTVFTDAKPLAVLNTALPRRTTRAAAGFRSLNARTLAVYDPKGSVAAFLKKANIGVTVLNSLNGLPKVKVLVVGPDALDAAASTSSALAAFAAGGGRVIVLEQDNPLKYGALPAEMGAAQNAGATAFIEDAGHPALRGLQNADFFTWSGDGTVYRNAYEKPQRGARSLVQAHELLKYSALAEVPVGPGLLMLSQLQVGAKLKDSAVARQLLVNLLDYAAGYKQEFRAVAAAIRGAPLLMKALDTLGLQYSPASDPLAAIGGKAKIALIEATPANLHALAANPAKVKAFNAAGGYIVLHGLTPEGLGDYNKIVGFEHMIRPMRRERVSFPPVKDPLTAGLSLSDVALYSSERIFPYQEGNYASSETFSYVVDYEDVAPFARSDSFLFENAVNNFFQADAWKLINNFVGPEQIPMTLPRPQILREFIWVGNTLYCPVTKVNLVLDGKDTLSFATAPHAEPQPFAIQPPRAAREITLQMTEWQRVPGKQNDKGQDIIGLDNIYLLARRPPEFYRNVKPLLNIGGMMHYPRGAGGIVLCNLRFKETEDVPDNAARKRNALAAILRNLQAPFSGGKTVIAGAHLAYAPVAISKQANQYRTERGWFGDPRFTFKDLPTGNQRFAGVLYNVYEFPTSPVPTAIMLGGSGIPNNPAEEVRGIPVGRRADALFFLHTARMDARRSADEVKANKKYEMARYIVHYADGQTATVPVYAEIHIDDYRQKTPQSLPGAQAAWSKPYPNSEQSAVAYSMQWNNPRPDVAITALDFTYGPDRRGVPALLAVTAATAQ